MYPLARVGTRGGTPLYSASLVQPGQCIYFPVLVLVLVLLVQCFAWSARAMNLFARVHTCTVCESLHSVDCACIPLTVLRLVRTGYVPTCPCSYSYWYFLCSASLGQHGQCTYLAVVVLVLVSARVMYLLARVRAGTGTSCAVLRLDSTGNVPTCPWSYSHWYLLCSASLGQHGLCTYVPVLVSLYSVCAVLCLDSTGNVPTCPWSYWYWYLLCSALLGQHGYVPIVLVPLVQYFAWTARAMYLRACACIFVQCFTMGNPSHVRILVFELSRCTCSATPTDMDSLLVMLRDGFYVRCICAGCLHLTCRGSIVPLPVCTADREGGWQPRLIYTMYIIHHVYIKFR